MNYEDPRIEEKDRMLQSQDSAHNRTQMTTASMPWPLEKSVYHDEIDRTW